MRATELKIVELNAENIMTEHICCGFSSLSDKERYEAKKELMRKRFKEGYRFKKFDVHHKVFIEYVPAEYSWAPVNAPGYMFISCLRVGGRYKKQGLGSRLLEECIRDSEDKNGIVILSSSQKKPFLADKRFLIRRGFELFDIAPPYFELMGIKFAKGAADPKFTRKAKVGMSNHVDGITFYYTDQCPFTRYYTEKMAQTAENMGFRTHQIHVTSHNRAHAIPSGYGVFNVFLNGQFLTHEMMEEHKFEKLLKSIRYKW